MTQVLTQGVYRHYKGNLYMVLGIAKHSENLDNMVMYRALYVDDNWGAYAYWVRPLSMFLEEVELEGNKVPRFSKVSDSESREILATFWNALNG